MLRLRRGTWWGKSWFVGAVLRLRGRSGFGALRLWGGFLGWFGYIDDVEDGIGVVDVLFGRLIVECRMRLAKPVFLSGLAGKGVG